MEDLAQKRGEGSLLGLVVGDALGSQVEFMNPHSIRKKYPQGVREMRGSQIWNTAPGQGTDDSEMALSLAHAIINAKGYCSHEALAWYTSWFDSKPFDIGHTVSSALSGHQLTKSLANGALMRVAPIGIWGSSLIQKDEKMGVAVTCDAAKLDAELTHPNPVTVAINQFYAVLLARTIAKPNSSAEENLKAVLEWAWTVQLCDDAIDMVHIGARVEHHDFTVHAGLAEIAFKNAIWHYSRGSSFEDAMILTISKGGDTDTNGAILGALLGALGGVAAIPTRWRGVVEGCTLRGDDTPTPRPEVYWPSQARRLASELLALGGYHANKD